MTTWSEEDKTTPVLSGVVVVLAWPIGAIAVAVKPVYLLLEAHTLGAGRLHADDTTVPRLAKYKTDIARMWTYVCDDAPFAGGRAPSALFYYSSNRKGEHSREHLAGYRGILQADNYSGYNALYDPGRPEGTITHAACWAHARRYLFELADIATQMKRKPGKRVVISPLAFEAVAADFPKLAQAITAFEERLNSPRVQDREAFQLYADRCAEADRVDAFFVAQQVGVLQGFEVIDTVGSAQRPGGFVL